MNAELWLFNHLHQGEPTAKSLKALATTLPPRLISDVSLFSRASPMRCLTADIVTFAALLTTVEMNVRQKKRIDTVFNGFNSVDVRSDRFMLDHEGRHVDLPEIIKIINEKLIAIVDLYSDESKQDDIDKINRKYILRYIPLFQQTLLEIINTVLKAQIRK